MYQQIMCCQVSQKQSWQRSRQGFQNCPVVMGVGRHKVSRKSWKHDEIIDVRTKSCIKSYKLTLHISICPSWTKNKITSPPNIKLQHVKSCWEDSLRIEHYFTSWPRCVYNINVDTQIAPLATWKHNSPSKRAKKKELFFESTQDYVTPSISIPWSLEVDL